MLKKIAIGFVALLAVLLIVIAIQPETYHVERTRTLAAPIEAVWAETSDFNRWGAWSPWQAGDPSQKTVQSGQPGTLGHKSEWNGEKTGTGVMTLSEVETHKKMVMTMDFFTPMKGTGTASMLFKPQGDSVEMTWMMDGKNDFVGKFFCLIMDMDAMIGGQYEQGMDRIEDAAQKAAAKN